MLEINKTQIELKVFGNEYKLVPPTARKVAQFKKQLDEQKEDVEMISLAEQFLSECGLPKEVCEELEMEHLAKVIDLISGKKK